MKSKFLCEGVIYEYEEGHENDCTKIKHVPAASIVATLEGCWRGEVRWKRAGEKVSFLASLSGDQTLILTMGPGFVGPHRHGPALRRAEDGRTP
mgnify:CR=1 FL=1